MEQRQNRFVALVLEDFDGFFIQEEKVAIILRNFLRNRFKATAIAELAAEPIGEEGGNDYLFVNRG